MSTPHPTCPNCADELDGVDYVSWSHGYAETVWVCERCDAHYSREQLVELADAEAEAE